MRKKKDPTRYTIGFNPSLINHLKAIKILLSIPERAKAHTIADALVLYNQTFGLVDVSSVDDILQAVIESEERIKANPKPVSTQKAKSEDVPKDEPLILDDYSYNDEEFDEDEDVTESDGSEYNDIFTQSLMSMGFKKESED